MNVIEHVPDETVSSSREKSRALSLELEAGE
jgi:hypothetical protein